MSAQITETEAHAIVFGSADLSLSSGILCNRAAGWRKQPPGLRSAVRGPWWWKQTSAVLCQWVLWKHPSTPALTQLYWHSRIPIASTLALHLWINHCWLTQATSWLCLLWCCSVLVPDFSQTMQTTLNDVEQRQRSAGGCALPLQFPR